MNIHELTPGTVIQGPSGNRYQVKQCITNSQGLPSVVCEDANRFQHTFDEIAVNDRFQVCPLPLAIDHSRSEPLDLPQSGIGYFRRGKAVEKEK